MTDIGPRHHVVLGRTSMSTESGIHHCRALQSLRQGVVYHQKAGEEGTVLKDVGYVCAYSADRRLILKNNAPGQTAPRHSSDSASAKRYSNALTIFDGVVRSDGTVWS